MKKVLILLVVFIGLILGQNNTQAADPIHVGITTQRSGPFKTNGDRFLAGIETAIKETNDAGGLLGRPVKLIVEDSQGKPDIGVQKFKKLILENKCEAIFEGSTSACALAMSQLMPRYKKIMVSIGQYAMDLTGKHFEPYYFRTDANVAMQARPLAMYLSERMKLKKVYMINQDYSYGHDVANIYERSVKELAPDTQIVGKDFHPIFNKDFAPYISKVKASGADYILSGNWGTDMIQLILQARRLGLKIPVAGILMSDLNVLAAMPGDEAVGCLGVTSFLLGLDTPKAKRFEESFYDKSGGIWPVEQTWAAYKAFIIYSEAVKSAGSLDVDKLIKNFEGLSWNGPTGPSFIRAKDHQLIHPMIVAEVVKKTKYFDFPFLKPVQLIPADQLEYRPEDFGWKPYTEK